MARTIEVPEKVLEHILNVARDGEAQVVPFSRDNNEMARDAAKLSKHKCANICEMLLAVLTDSPVELIGK